LVLQNRGCFLVHIYGRFALLAYTEEDTSVLSVYIVAPLLINRGTSTQGYFFLL
jgi:hypothetical protein